MNVDYDIYFDEEFSAVMTHLGEEISPASLSTGEAKKVDIVVLLALIKLIKIKFSQLNILFLDEVFSSVDINNVYHMIRSLGKITRELKLNTIVVNHSILPHEEFDYILRTDKKNGFSSIELEKVN
jgi:energy-coupling factor transporter ATP-binding protein EcfA2